MTATTIPAAPRRPVVARAGPPPGALLLGADYRALGAVRSLGRRGIDVAVLRERDEPLAALSRFARRDFAWAAGDDAARVAFLIELAARESLAGWALIPSADQTAALVARHHDALAEHFVLTSPAWPTLRWVYDKRLTYELADRLDIAVPRTARPGSAAEAAEVELGFPAILKPAVKEGHNRLTAAKAWRVDGPQELAARWEEAAGLVDPDVLLVQELVPGGGEGQFSYVALCDDGEPRAALTARRTRQYPADFGRASTYVETVSCPELVEPSRRLLRALRFSGLVELEYKRDPRDGVLKLLDINPRLWGWHSLCGRAGVDFPYLLWRQTSGEPALPVTPRDGVGWLRLSTDTPTALRELIGGRLSAREYARSLRGPREAAIFARDDPMPGLTELPLLAFLLGRRLLRGEGV
jgi:predicted ATP-grasp superfamily ATP-dependent carboligase